jgi:hypothetical protein
MDTQGWGVDRWANHLSLLLNAANPADRYRFDIGQLAIEVSRTFFPEDPITKVIEDDLDGFGGALLPSESGKRWGILYDRNTSPQRRRFTIGHEFGHYLLHRTKFPEGSRTDILAAPSYKHGCRATSFRSSKTAGRATAKLWSLPTRPQPVRKPAQSAPT